MNKEEEWLVNMLNIVNNHDNINLSYVYYIDNVMFNIHVLCGLLILAS